MAIQAFRCLPCADRAAIAQQTTANVANAMQTDLRDLQRYRAATPLRDQRSGERDAYGDSANPHPRCFRHRAKLATIAPYRNHPQQTRVIFADLCGFAPFRTGSSTDTAACVLPKLTTTMDTCRSAYSSANGQRHCQGSLATSSSTAMRGPVKNGVSSRTWRRASVARRSRIRSTMRCSSCASNARIHS